MVVDRARSPTGRSNRVGTPATGQQALAAAVEHRDGWLGGYRGVLGFASLVLVDARSGSSP